MISQEIAGRFIPHGLPVEGLVNYMVATGLRLAIGTLVEDYSADICEIDQLGHFYLTGFRVNGHFSAGHGDRHLGGRGTFLVTEVFPGKGRAPVISGFAD